MVIFGDIIPRPKIRRGIAWRPLFLLILLALGRTRAHLTYAWFSDGSYPVQYATRGGAGQGSTRTHEAQRAVSRTLPITHQS